MSVVGHFSASQEEVRSDAVNGHRCPGTGGPKSASFGLMHRTKTGQCSITASARVRVGSFGQPRLPKTLSHQLRV